MIYSICSLSKSQLDSSIACFKSSTPSREAKNQHIKIYVTKSYYSNAVSKQHGARICCGIWTSTQKNFCFLDSTLFPNFGVSCCLEKFSSVSGFAPDCVGCHEHSLLDALFKLYQDRDESNLSSLHAKEITISLYFAILSPAICT